MTSPASALAWETWQRHRNRLLAIVILIASFALFYPRMCAFIGLDLNAPNALDSIATTFSGRLKDARPLSMFFQVISLLFLLLGPLACMVISLLYVVWIFTFAQLDPKKGFVLPARLFILPVSTPFLAAWFMGVGLVSLVSVYLGWTFLVHLPNIDVFLGYPNCLAWATLLVIAQAIIWALDAFPVARVLALCAALSGFGFMTGPGLGNHPFLVQNQTVILLSCLTFGCTVAFAGLGKIRHGAWQCWTWKLRLSSPMARAGISQAKKFRSPAQAQFWFEWRTHTGKLFFYVCALSSAAVLIMSVVAARMGSLSEGDLFGLTLYLLCVPLFIHLAHGIAPERNPPPFTATHPLTSGDIVKAKLTTAALSAALSWGVTLAMLCVVPLLGDVPVMLRNLPIPASYQLQLRPLLPVIFLSLIGLTWRFVAADLCFAWTGKSWVATLAVVKAYAVGGLVFLLAYLARNPRFEGTLYQVLPLFLGGLVGLKLFLAQWAFRAAINRQLLARSTVLKYLAAWLALAATVLIPTLIVFHNEPWIVSIALGIVLLLPLARIGFSPIALSHGRHR